MFKNSPLLVLTAELLYCKNIIESLEFIFVLTVLCFIYCYQIKKTKFKNA